MNEMHTGQATVAPDVVAVAEALLADGGEDTAVLTGITLMDADTSRPVLLDLVVLSSRAAVVGVDTGREPGQLVTPREAGRQVVRLQQTARLPTPLRVYVFWLGDTPGNLPPGAEADPSPALADVAQIRNFIRQANRQNAPAPAGTVQTLADLLLQADSGAAASGPPTPPLRKALRIFDELNLLDQVLPAGRRVSPILPADISKRLRAAMLDRKQHLEDVNYGKVVPNDYVIELNPENYERHYQPIEQDVTEQWRKRLLDDLNTANSRQGRKQYRFGGPVQVRLRPAPQLAENEVNIIARVQAEARLGPEARPVEARPGPEVRLEGGSYGCLEQLPGGRRWPLQEGTVVLGRSRGADIRASGPQVQELRLVSSIHAHIICSGGQCRLYDGGPDGKRSLNGTYLNGRRLGTAGERLQPGDQIILASLDPEAPRLDTPGIVVYTFHAVC